MCDCDGTEIENLKDQVCNIDIAFRNAEAELSIVRDDLAGTTKTLDKYRELHVMMTHTIRTLTEERDTTREVLQGVTTAYSDLLGLYAKNCSEYDALVSRYDDLLLRNDSEHG